MKLWLPALAVKDSLWREFGESMRGFLWSGPAKFALRYAGIVHGKVIAGSKQALSEKQPTFHGLASNPSCH
jgi:hypothetical protein